MLRLYACLVVLILTQVPVSGAQPSASTLPEIVRQTLALHFSPEDATPIPLSQFARKFRLTPYFRQHQGVFVTLSKNGDTRACWGSIYPQHGNLIEDTIYTTEDALNKDYRHRLIRSNEWQSLKAQVTVVKDVKPISDLSNQNPLTDGLMVRSGGRAAVLLPGEAVDAHYQMVQCKLKAGIDPRQRCQMYRIKADVFR